MLIFLQEPSPTAQAEFTLSSSALPKLTYMLFPCQTVDSWRTGIVSPPSWSPQSLPHCSAHSRASANVSCTESKGLSANLWSMKPSRPRARATRKRSRPHQRGQRGPYPFIEALEGLDIICQGVHLGLELDLVHAGSVRILGNTERGQLPPPTLPLATRSPRFPALSPHPVLHREAQSLRANQPMCRAKAAPGFKAGRFWEQHTSQARDLERGVGN